MDRPRQVAFVSRFEHLEAVVAEIGADRGRARDDDRLPHRDQVVHLVAVRQVTERITADGHDPDVGVGDTRQQRLDRNESVAEPHDLTEAHFPRERHERRAMRPVAIDLEAKMRDPRT